MKIKTDELSRLITEQVGKKPKQKEATKFGEILQRTIESTETQTQKGTGAQAVASVQGVQGPGTVEEQQGPILERVEQLLDTLEEYQRNLGSASIPSESLKPLINRMEDHNKALAAVLVTLPDGDNLKDVLNRVLITSVVEVEKFKRGDYS
jgi:hypothetical protein